MLDLLRLRADHVVNSKMSDKEEELLEEVHSDSDGGRVEEAEEEEREGESDDGEFDDPDGYVDDIMDEGRRILFSQGWGFCIPYVWLKLVSPA